MADVTSGHNVRATVYVEADPMRPMYRRTGPAALQSLGEVEFANGVAAMAASESFSDVQVCAGIVGFVDLRLGTLEVEEILGAHIRAGGGRYRGVRRSTPSSKVPNVLRDPSFRRGFSCLQKMGLSFDALVREPELPDLIDLARQFPETVIVLNHLGLPQQRDRFETWRDNIRTLATCQNVCVKLGGLGMSSPTGLRKIEGSFRSDELSVQWKPYIETCIEAFGAERSMFESNFPVDSITCTYSVLWNTFKRLMRGASKDETRALFSGTAARVYRVTL